MNDVAAIWPIILRLLPYIIPLVENLFPGQGRGSEKLPAALGILKLFVSQVAPGHEWHLDDPAVQVALQKVVDANVELFKALTAASANQLSVPPSKPEHDSDHESNVPSIVTPAPMVVGSFHGGART